LLAALRIVRRGAHRWSVIGLVACSCAGVLTHPRGYFLVPFAVIALAIGTWRVHPPLRRALVAGAGALAVMGLAIAGAMLWVRGHTTQGTAGSGSGNPALTGLNPRQFLSYLWQFYLPKLGSMDPKVGPPYGYRQVYIESFFGQFASFSVNYRVVYYDALQAMAGFGLVALYTTVV